MKSELVGIIKMRVYSLFSLSVGFVIKEIKRIGAFGVYNLSGVYINIVIEPVSPALAFRTYGRYDLMVFIRTLLLKIRILFNARHRRHFGKRP